MVGIKYEKKGEKSSVLVSHYRLSLLAVQCVAKIGFGGVRSWSYSLYRLSSSSGCVTIANIGYLKIDMA